MSDTKRPSAVNAFLKMKCPKCRTGDMFVVKNPYNLNRIADMPEHCPYCNQSNFPETGFYFGAMYTSYMLTVAVSVIVTLLYWLLFGFDMWGIIIVDSLLLVFTFPYMYRYARVLWLWVTVYFDIDSWKAAQMKKSL